MLGSEAEFPMNPPAARPCPKCARDLSPRIDRKTGKRVATRGRAMLECAPCGHIEIGKDPVAWQRRFRLVRLLTLIATALLFIYEALREVLRIATMAGTDSVFKTWDWTKPLWFGLMACAVTYVLFNSLAHVLSWDQPMSERIGHGAIVAFWFAMLALLLWAAFWVH